MARQFRNVIFHNESNTVIPKISDNTQQNQEWLARLQDMALHLLSYLNSDNFKESSRKKEKLSMEMIIKEVNDKFSLFKNIIEYKLAPKPSLSQCFNQLRTADEELELYKALEAQTDHKQNLEQLVLISKGFTSARISTYAGYLKWGNDRSVYFTLPNREVYDQHIGKGREFRHVIKRSTEKRFGPR